MSTPPCLGCKRPSQQLCFRVLSLNVNPSVSGVQGLGLGLMFCVQGRCCRVALLWLALHALSLTVQTCC